MAFIPFPEDLQLIDKIGVVSTTSTSALAAAIPGRPSIKLNDRPEVAKYLQTEFACTVIDELYSHMYLVARKAGSHIDPLHEHLLKDRSLRLTEDIGLHLVWYPKGVYLKPLPLCLLSHTFWRDAIINQHLPIASSQHAAALGFIRSYAYLIRYRSDFEIAQDNHLLPRDLHYTDFALFIHEFLQYGDYEVSLRWHYGQIRLSRLNWAVRLLRPASRRGKSLTQQLYYRERYWSTTQALQETAAPLAFLFATISIILSAMQVALATGIDNIWLIFGDVSWWFSVAILIMLLALIMGTLAFIFLTLGRELRFALMNK